MKHCIVYFRFIAASLLLPCLSPAISLAFEMVWHPARDGVQAGALVDTCSSNVLCVLDFRVEPESGKNLIVPAVFPAADIYVVDEGGRREKVHSVPQYNNRKAVLQTYTYRQRGMAYFNSLSGIKKGGNFNATDFLNSTHASARWLEIVPVLFRMEGSELTSPVTRLELPTIKVEIPDGLRASLKDSQSEVSKSAADSDSPTEPKILQWLIALGIFAVVVSLLLRRVSRRPPASSRRDH